MSIILYTPFTFTTPTMRTVHLRVINGRFLYSFTCRPIQNCSQLRTQAQKRLRVRAGPGRAPERTGWSAAAGPKRQSGSHRNIVSSGSCCGLGMSRLLIGRRLARFLICGSRAERRVIVPQSITPLPWEYSRRARCASDSTIAPLRPRSRPCDTGMYWKCTLFAISAPENRRHGDLSLTR